jgi:hypothetical protein
MDDQERIERLVKELEDADRLNGMLIRKLEDIRMLIEQHEEDDLIIQIKAILERRG